MDAEQIVEAAKKVDKVLITALQDVDWVDPDARASIITTAVAMYLRREEPNLKTIDFFAAACISIDPIGALERIAEYLDPGRRLRDMARAGSDLSPEAMAYFSDRLAKCVQLERQIKEDRGASGEATLNSYELCNGLEQGVVKWMADEETGVELLRLLTAYQRGADRGELKAFLDVRRPI